MTNAATPHRAPVWHHADDGLHLRWGRRDDSVPEQIQAQLTGPDGPGLSADAAEDLLRSEGQARRVVANLAEAVNQAESHVTEAEEQVKAAAEKRGWGTHRLRRTAGKSLDAATSEHSAVVSQLEEARDLVDALREFVIELDPPNGILTEAVRGWRRGRDLPAGIVVFDDEASFLATDSRRQARTGWVYSSIDGDEYGLQWRRDGDDDPFVDPLERTGPWQVGYIARTQEIYATRRSDTLPEQVWLLGKGLTASQAHQLLTGLEPRMREPNSLILVATAAYAARHIPPAAEEDDPEYDSEQDRAAEQSPITGDQDVVVPGQHDGDQDALTSTAVTAPILMPSAAASLVEPSRMRDERGEAG
jgi:hypothetical protein